MTILLTTSGFLAAEVRAQDRGESEALSVGVRTALTRVPGGRVVSAERINSGNVGMSRIKIVDRTGRMQVVVIEDARTRMRQTSPFEPEEGIRRGRFSPRAEPPMPQINRTGGRKPRSSDVEN